MSTAHSQLQYAAPPSAWRVYLRRAALPLLLVSLVAVGILFGPAAVRHVELISWQRRAMQYTLPSDHVVYESDPARAAALLRSSSDFLPLNSSGVPVVEFSRIWREFYSRAEPPGRKPGALLFLHERHTPEGQHRLVAIDTQSSPGALAPGSVGIAVFRPGSLMRRPALLSEEAWRTPFNGARSLRIYAGQADEADPSHLVIRYELDGASGTIDGWLRDDDRVILELRHGSLQ
jgi:hypothetical protein